MTKAHTIGALLAAFAVTALFAFGAALAGGAGDFVLPGSAAATAGRCVEDTEFMRRNHFEVIRHQRDETVYGGIRSTKHSLAGCVSCHVVHDPAGTPVEINGQGQFCAACHAYAAVNMNCFDCHATVPEGEGWNHEAARLPAAPAIADLAPDAAGVPPAPASALATPAVALE